MLRKIDTQLLQPGMFLQELCGTWIDHPFWRTSFKLKDAGEIAKIINSGIKEALIDTDKGLDVEVATVDAPPPVQARPPAAPQPAKAARPGYTPIEADNVMPLVKDISSSVARNPGALISIARLKTADDYTYMHSVAVCGLMIALARQLNLDETQTREAGMAGLLHDVGKMAIPLEVLNKPGKLTDDEFTLIKGHPAAGH